MSQTVISVGGRQIAVQSDDFRAFFLKIFQVMHDRRSVLKKKYKSERTIAKHYHGYFATCAEEVHQQLPADAKDKLLQFMRKEQSQKSTGAYEIEFRKARDQILSGEKLRFDMQAGVTYVEALEAAARGEIDPVDVEELQNMIAAGQKEIEDRIEASEANFEAEFAASEFKQRFVAAVKSTMMGEAI